MGSISGMLGLGGGAGGSGFAGPQAANIVQPFNAQSATGAVDQSQQALQQQQAFLQAVQAQHGLQNQSNVFNQMQNVANGTGPNPAQAQLAQATGANTANQAALMAGQRGSGANAGMIARQASMQGGANQQQAAGQAATMQAQQSLNALGQMGGMANQMAGQQAQATAANTAAVQGQQGQILGAIGAQNNANVGMQSGINAANASMASGRMTQQGNMLGNIAGGIGSALGLAQGGKVPHYAEGTDSVYQPIDPGSDPFASERMQYGADNYAPAALKAPNIMTPQGAAQLNAQAGPKSNVGKHFSGSGTAMAGNMLGQGIGAAIKGIGNLIHPSQNPSQPMPTQQAPPDAMPTPDAMPMNDQNERQAARGGKVPAMVSPGEKYLSPQEAQAAKQGANPMKLGETIPGKPKVKGAKNDYANDTVPKTLEEGGLVLPRSVTQSKNPEWAAHRFVRDHMAKGGLVGTKSPKKGKK